MRTAARTRSRLLLTAESGSRAMVKDGKPGVMSTSRNKVAGSILDRVAERTHASTGPAWKHLPNPSTPRNRYARLQGHRGGA
jgi:hypothetical protein